MALPLSPPIAPQLARPRASLPEGDDWARAEVGRLSRDRVRRRGAGVPAVAQRQAAGALLPRLHVTARLAFHARTATLRLQASWPWAQDLAAAFARLKALPAPVG